MPSDKRLEEIRKDLQRGTRPWYDTDVEYLLSVLDAARQPEQGAARIVQRLNELPLIVAGSRPELFRTMRQIQEGARRVAETSARQPEQGWMPIETAPKDGRTILLGYFNPQKKWRTLRGQWFTSEQIADWENGDAFDENWYETSVENDEPPNCWLIDCPTHWMPLPAAPTETAAPAAQVCHWVTHPDTDCTAYETDCGQMWEFTEGGVKDNGVKFCPYCGKPIIEVVEDMYRDEDE